MTKIRQFKTQEEYEQFLKDSQTELQKWAENYKVPGCVIAKNAEGAIVHVGFGVKNQAEASLQAVQSVKESNKKTVIPEEDKGCKTCAAKGLKRLIMGGAKLLKSELGIDAADSDTVESRKRTCLSCDRYNFGVCEDCGCFCAAKVKLTSEKCPIGKW